MHTDILHQVVQRGFDQVHLGENTKLANLMMMMPRPAANIILNVVKQFIEPLQAGGDGLSILLMFCRVNELGGIENLIGFTIRLRITVAV